MIERKNIALLGATGNLGKYVLEEIINNKKYNVFILTRKINNDILKEKYNINFINTDYNNIELLTKIFNEKEIDTIISFIWTFNDDMYNIQLNVLKAAERSNVKTFIPSEWAIDTIKYPNIIKQYNPKILLQNELKKSKIEYSLFFNGLFMDYIGTNEKFIDFENGIAKIPGTGNELISFICLKDIAKFVVGSLELPKYDIVSGIEGDRKSLNEIIEMFEKYTNKKIKKVYIPIEEINKNINESKNDFIKNFFCNVDLCIAKEKMLVDPTLNKKLTYIKPLSIEEFIKNVYVNKNSSNVKNKFLN